MIPNKLQPDGWLPFPSPGPPPIRHAHITREQSWHLPRHHRPVGCCFTHNSSLPGPHKGWWGLKMQVNEESEKWWILQSKSVKRDACDAIVDT